MRPNKNHLRLDFRFEPPLSHGGFTLGRMLVMTCLRLLTLLCAHQRVAIAYLTPRAAVRSGAVHCGGAAAGGPQPGGAQRGGAPAGRAAAARQAAVLPGARGALSLLCTIARLSARLEQGQKQVAHALPPQVHYIRHDGMRSLYTCDTACVQEPCAVPLMHYGAPQHRSIARPLLSH